MAVGVNSLKAVTTGDFNIGIGFQTARTITTGIKNLAFALGKEYKNLFLFFASSPEKDKAMLTCYISKELANDRGYDAGKVVRELGKLIHGGGGGQNFFATAGGKNPGGIPKALEKVKEYLAN